MFCEILVAIFVIRSEISSEMISSSHFSNNYLRQNRNSFRINAATDFKKTFGFPIKRQDAGTDSGGQSGSDPTDQFLDSVFQVPIQTLTVVNQLVKDSRPIIQNARDRIKEHYQMWQNMQQMSSANQLPDLAFKPRPSHHFKPRVNRYLRPSLRI